MTPMDLYQLLGVRRTATIAEVRRAYQKHARRLHPDLNPGDPVARQRFEEISRAFEVLSDAQRRAEYDRGEVRAAPRPRVADVGFAGFDFSAEVQAGGVGFHQIFEGVLAGGGRPPARPPAARTSSSRPASPSTRPFAGRPAAFTSCAWRPALRAEERGTCAIGPQPCETCGGGGQVRARRGRMIFTRPCRECGSSGVVAHRPCARCAGEGRSMQSEWAEVEIPRGVREGSRIRLPGLGNAGRRGGPAGDFHLVIDVEPHPLYRRQDDDLHCEVPVTMTEAALGVHVEVPTPDGPVVIEMPAGTQTGQRFRMRKRGMPRPAGQGRGDLYVEARVWVPAVRDDESRELLREFERRNRHDPRRDLGRGRGTEGALMGPRGKRARAESSVASEPGTPPGRGKYYMISVVAKSYGVHPQTLRLYEREGLLKPSRTEGNTRLYSEDDLRQLEVILNLTRDLGVNLAGVEIVLNMRRKMEQMQAEMNEFVAHVRQELERGAPDGLQEKLDALVKVPPATIVRAPEKG